MISMDPITIGMAALAVFSAIMGIGQAVETYALWRLQRQIPGLIEKGAIELVSSEKFRQKLITASAEEISKRLKLSVFGALGAEKKLEKKFAGALVEGDDSVNQFVGMLPKKAQEMIKAHPQLLEFGIRMFQNYVGGMANAETTEGAH